MGLLDSLSDLFSGGSGDATSSGLFGGLSSLGSAPSVQPQASPAAQVLARLNPPAPANVSSPGVQASANPMAQILARLSPSAPGGGTAPNPLGLAPAVGGNDLGIALGGLSQVRPGSGRFSSFAQGLAGGLNARANAQVENTKLATQQQAATLDNYLKGLQINGLQRQQDAIDKVSGIGAGGGGGGYPSWYDGPGTGQGGAPAAPATGAPPATPGRAAPPPPIALPGGAGGPSSPMPSSAAPAQPDPQDASPTAAATTAPPRTINVSQDAAESQRLWRHVPPEGNPFFLRSRASVMDQKALTPGLPADMANNFSRQAQQDRQSAQAIIDSGKVTLDSGAMGLIPGSMEADATKAAAVASAEEHARKSEDFRAAAGTTTSGTPYLPDPTVAPSAPSFTTTPGNAPPAAAPVVARPPMPTGAAPQTPAPQTPSPGIPAPGVPTAGNMPSPQSSSVDPETAAVSTVIPKAPAGGGYPIPPDLPPGAKMTGLSPAGQAVKDADVDYYKAMGSAPALDQTIERYQSMGQAFKLFESGPRADKTQGAAMIAMGLGQPEIAQKILGGDPNALQWVEKEGAPLTLNTLRAASPRGFAQSEFKTVYNSSVPNPAKLPQANNQMIAEGLAQAQMLKQFHTDWQTAQGQGWQSPSAFYQSWSKANPASSFITAAQRQIGNFKGMATPSPDRWAKGVSYVYEPKGMSPQQQAIFQQEGVKPGGLFRFNGRSADHAISPIDTSGGKGFSSYLGGQP